MGKSLYIAEKPSVAREFGKALKMQFQNKNGYMEAGEAVLTWCVGHLVTMSYPEAYDPKYKRWSLDTIPFIPDEFRYEVIDQVKQQYLVVEGLLNRPDITVIYVCTDSGREGEYIYRLVEQQAKVSGKIRKRVWIDSQTEEEILRGIKEAKDLSEYDNLSEAAYLRAKEDYLMGINFSRVLTLKYGTNVKNFLKKDRAVISVGRVMTCVLGMVVNREREIREFVKTPFYRLIADFGYEDKSFEGEWKAVENTKYYASPLLYKENGFREKKTAEELLQTLLEEPVSPPVVRKIEKKKESKNPPLLFNLAELQNECSKLFKISPDETLRIVQELYEKKLVTYPRTDARVLSTAVCKEIVKNIRGLKQYQLLKDYAAEIEQAGSYQGLEKTRYVNDKQITDHYAIIPTGQGIQALSSLAPAAAKVYEVIARRFLSIFYPAAIYQKVSLMVSLKEEFFFSNFKVLFQEGYLKLMKYSFSKKDQEEVKEEGGEKGEEKCDDSLIKMVGAMKTGTHLTLKDLTIKEGETSPPKRYNSGAMILTMENAGQFIEDEELRAQIKGSGIGTSATRAEILKKLIHIEYLALNKKTQMITPTLLGEIIYDVVSLSIRPLLDPALTASWEKGLTMVAKGSITGDEYMHKLDDFVSRRTNSVKTLRNQTVLYDLFAQNAVNYK